MKTANLCLLVVTCAFLFGCHKKSDDDQNFIKVGEVGSFTGSEATFGISTHKGIELAFNELNKAGGVLGKKLKIVKYDNQGKEDESVIVMNRLINEDKVVAVLGEVASNRSKVMAPVAQANKVPMVSPSSTNVKVTELGDYIFRVCFIDPFQGLVMSKFAKNDLKVTKVAVIRDLKNAYSMGLADAFIDAFKKTGGEIVADVSYTQGDLDFKAQLTTVRGKEPQAIFIPGYYTDVALIARQSRELGIKVPLMGGDGWDSPKLFEIGGKGVEGAYISSHYSSDDPSPNVQSFAKRYKDSYGEEADGLAAMGYEAAVVLVDAIKRANSVDSKAIRDALAATKDFLAVTGKITIDEKRNAVKPAVVLRVEGGKFKYVKTIIE